MINKILSNPTEIINQNLRNAKLIVYENIEIFVNSIYDILYFRLDLSLESLIIVSNSDLIRYKPIDDAKLNCIYVFLKILEDEELLYYKIHTKVKSILNLVVNSAIYFMRITEDKIN